MRVKFRWIMSLGKTDLGKCILIKSSSHTHCPLLILSQPSAAPPQAPTSFPIHVACMHVQSVSLSLLLH